MSLGEKFCLSWNGFETNTSSTFRSLRGDDAFTDVTLVGEDLRQIRAHKVGCAGRPCVPANPV